VAAAMQSVCAVNGCDFAVYLGDNFYPTGVVDTADVQFTDAFETPYGGLGFPFYAVLGNHDWGGGGGGYDITGPQAEVDYTALSSMWTMPDFFYTETVGDATFFTIDTTSIDQGYGADQELWLPGEIAAATTTWKILLGHHPYISNGPHGNAGTYEGIAGAGALVETFFTSYVCGQVDVYLAGHDHSMQWLQPTCGTEFIVSGGGSSPSVMVGTNATNFEDAALGFLWVEIDGRTFTGVFYDDTGTELYRASITK
jgi:3',5'-cyclic AMP phosphodiesterase CpdA